MAFALYTLLLLSLADLRPADPSGRMFPPGTPSPPGVASDALCRVSLEPRGHRPGDVVPVTAGCDAGLVDFRATLAASSVPFFPVEAPERAAVPSTAVAPDGAGPGSAPPPDASGAALAALVGLDLRTRPGAIDLVWEARFENGARVSGAHVIDVLPRSFPVQRLRLPRGMVTPDPATLERAAREALKLAAVLSTFTPGRIWRGPFAAPVPDARGGGFGARRVLNGRMADPHAGMDLRAPTGTPVQASNAGVVALVDTLFYGGKTVVLDHGLGLFTTYSHLSQVSVMEGDSLNGGQLLGRVGATGRVTGPHLHWAVVLNGARVDPVSLIAATSGMLMEPAEIGPGATRE